MISVLPAASVLNNAHIVQIPERVVDATLPLVSDWSDVTTVLEVGLMMRDFTGNIGYDKFLACVYVPTAQPENSLFVLNGFQPRWMELYRERNYVSLDPVFRRQWESPEPFEWSELASSDFHPAVFEFFKEAMRHGLYSGLSFHVIGPAGAHLFLSFASGRYRNLGAQRDWTFGSALLFGTRALAVLIQLAEQDPNAIRRRLSARQLEALQWAAKGLSMREVGGKMGVSPATIEYLIRQAQVNVGANSREEAILHAAQMGLVSRHVDIAVTTSED
jgi:DNA-binding CsgD family transcriptional regulator